MNLGLGLGLPFAYAQPWSGVWTPATLFANGEQGAWYDPSDMGTMFVDAAGTTPVTRMEQPVGLILDKSKGLVLGSELVTNGTFDSNVNGWTEAVGAGASFTWDAGQGVLFTGTFGARAYQSFATTAGRTYRLVVSRTGGTAATSGYRVTTDATGGATGQIAAEITISGNFTRTLYFVATSSTTVVALISTVATAATVAFDNISVRELPGNHATQTTVTSRPVLSARVNLLTATETLATQTVTTRATTQTLRFEGAGTVTLSGTATGTYSAGSHNITTTAGNLTLTVSGTVTKADLRATNMGVGLPAYQSVNTATDYDTAGFPMYLRFDGVDDFLVTPSINFTGTDKMTVFAGVRKLSDAATGMVAELSVSSGTNLSSFNLTAPNSTGYGWRSVGTLFSDANSTGTPAPESAVLTGIGDIAADVSRLMRNGLIVANSTADQGTGNYGNYPLYIGRRGGTALSFNGHLYSLIVRGAQSTAQQIASAEAWVNQRTGAY